jgi:predicted permease
MVALVEVVVPVFALIGLGWLFAARGWIGEAGFAGLNRFVFALAAPALLFAGGTSAAAGGAGGAALAFFLGSMALYGGALWLARGAMRMPLGEAGTFALNGAFGNTVMMGVPLIAAAHGQPGLALLTGILALHSMVLLGTATVVAEIGLRARAPLGRVLRATALGVLRNPIVMAVALALLWRLLDLPLPGAARRTLELLGAAAPPVALFCLGASLAGFDARAGWRETLLTLLLKLAAMPLLVWIFARLLGLSPLETAVAVLAAALPTGANAFLLARRYGLAADRSGAAVLLGTLLSIGTLGALLVLFPGR